MRILLAGGAGFLGSHLAKRFLLSGHSVLIVDNFLTGSWANVERLWQRFGRDRLECVPTDVCVLKPRAYRFDAIVNLASPASPRDYLEHPLETLRVGSVGTQNLLEVARAGGGRFLMASTSEVYGDPQTHPQTESYWGYVNPIGPRSVYDEAKRFSEALCAAYARTHGLSVRIARIFNTYGPHMRVDDGRVIPTFIAQALHGQPLTVQGDGSQTRSYCYVSDLVAGLDRLLWSDVQGPVNLGNPEEFTVLETTQIIRRLTASSSPIVHVPLPQDDPRVRRPDITRARTLLGWAPTTSLETGLKKTIGELQSRVWSSNGKVHGGSLAPVPVPASLRRAAS